MSPLINNNRKLENFLNFLIDNKSMDELILKVLNNLKDEINCNRIIAVLPYLGNNNFHYLNKSDIDIEFEKDFNLNSSLLFKKLEKIDKHYCIRHHDKLDDGLDFLNKENDNVLLFSFYFNDNLTALLIVYHDLEFTDEIIKEIENYNILFPFGIYSFRIQEINSNLEKRLQQAQKHETIGKMASGISHDFRNLLSSIFGSIDLLRNKIRNNEDALKYIDNIEKCSIRANDLTKDLLSFGKPTIKEKSLVKTKDLILEIQKVVLRTYPSDLKLTVNLDDNLFDFWGNSTEIYQVILNLCINAKEAMNVPGEVKILGSNLNINDGNYFYYPLLEKGNYIKISVSDTGSGIEEENLRKIFDPYFSTKQKETGSGLGLYVSYGIIKAHKGIIEVSSVINKGTQFDIFLPAYNPVNLNVNPNKIILLADDELMLRDLLAELLEANDYNVIKVSSGKEALKVLVEEIKVDLLIIDYKMPGMTGIECIKQMREMGNNIPVLLSTGSISFNNYPDFEKLKINSVVAKPYEFEVLLEKIQKLI